MRSPYPTQVSFILTSVPSGRAARAVGDGDDAGGEDHGPQPTKYVEQRPMIDAHSRPRHRSRPRGRLWGLSGEVIDHVSVGMSDFTDLGAVGGSPLRRNGRRARSRRRPRQRGLAELQLDPGDIGSNRKVDNSVYGSRGGESAASGASGAPSGASEPQGRSTLSSGGHALPNAGGAAAFPSSSGVGRTGVTSGIAVARRLDATLERVAEADRSGRRRSRKSSDRHGRSRAQTPQVHSRSTLHQHGGSGGLDGPSGRADYAARGTNSRDRHGRHPEYAATAQRLRAPTSRRSASFERTQQVYASSGRASSSRGSRAARRDGTGKLKRRPRLDASSDALAPPIARRHTARARGRRRADPVGGGSSGAEPGTAGLAWREQGSSRPFSGSDGGDEAPEPRTAGRAARDAARAQSAASVVSPSDSASTDGRALVGALRTPLLASENRGDSSSGAAAPGSLPDIGERPRTAPHRTAGDNRDSASGKPGSSRRRSRRSGDQASDSRSRREQSREGGRRGKRSRSKERSRRSTRNTQRLQLDVSGRDSSASEPPAAPQGGSPIPENLLDSLWSPDELARYFAKSTGGTATTREDIAKMSLAIEQLEYEAELARQAAGGKVAVSPTFKPLFQLLPTIPESDNEEDLDEEHREETVAPGTEGADLAAGVFEDAEDNVKGGADTPSGNDKRGPASSGNTKYKSPEAKPPTWKITQPKHPRDWDRSTRTPEPPKSLYFTDDSTRHPFVKARAGGSEDRAAASAERDDHGSSGDARANVMAATAESLGVTVLRPVQFDGPEHQRVSDMKRSYDQWEQTFKDSRGVKHGSPSTNAAAARLGLVKATGHGDVPAVTAERLAAQWDVMVLPQPTLQSSDALYSPKLSRQSDSPLLEAKSTAGFEVPPVVDYSKVPLSSQRITPNDHEGADDPSSVTWEEYVDAETKESTDKLVADAKRRARLETLRRSPSPKRGSPVPPRDVNAASAPGRGFGAGPGPGTTVASPRDSTTRDVDLPSAPSFVDEAAARKKGVRFGARLVSPDDVTRQRNAQLPGPADTPVESPIGNQSRSAVIGPSSPALAAKAGGKGGATGRSDTHMDVDKPYPKRASHPGHTATVPGFVEESTRQGKGVPILGRERVVAEVNRLRVAADSPAPGGDCPLPTSFSQAESSTVRWSEADRERGSFTDVAERHAEQVPSPADYAVRPPPTLTVAPSVTYELN